MIASPPINAGRSPWDRVAAASLVAAVAALPLVKSIQLPWIGSRAALFDLAALLTIGSWAAARTRDRSWRTVDRAWSIDAPLLALFAVSIASGWTVWRALGSRVAMTQFTIEVIVLAYILAFFLAARDVLIRNHLLPAATLAWTCGAAVAGALGIVGTMEMFRCHTPLSSLVLWQSRLTSTFTNPNQLAAYLVPTVPVTAAVWVAAANRRRLGVFAALVAFSSMVALLFTGSRGGLVGIIAAIAAMVILQRRSIRALAAVFTVVAVALLVFALAHQRAERGNACLAYMNENVRSLTVRLADELGVARILFRNAPAARVTFGGDTASAFVFRAQMARYALLLAATHPLGAGIGTMHLYIYEMTDHQAYVDAHDMFLTVLAETGFVGAALFVWAVAWFLWTAFTLARRSTSAWLRTVAAGMAAGLAGYILMSTSFDAQRQRVLWVAFAWVYAAWRQSATQMARPNLV